MQPKIKAEVKREHEEHEKHEERLPQRMHSEKKSVGSYSTS